LPYDEAQLAMVASQFPPSDAAFKIEYEKKLANVLASDTPILPLENIDDPQAELAQSLLLADPRLKAAMFERESGKPLRSEVMSIKPALPGDRVGVNTSCWEGGCYRVDLYNFFYNATATALVDTSKKQVVSISSIGESQPELSARLKELANAIANHEPAVQYEIERYTKFMQKRGVEENVSALMSDTKTALNNTLCERSKHLCVAPTFVLGDRALWVIVDLTDLKVVGLRWTKVGQNEAPVVVTERSLENEYVFNNFCQKVNQIQRNGWSFDYHITTSDGLRLAQAKYNNKPVFKSAKVVDWHVSYSYKDSFGYSDATGCPMFSSAVVVAFDGPVIEPIMHNDKEIGFSIAQDFRQQAWPAPCNYRYEERYEFYNDGRFNTAMISHGRGCGDHGTYRPILRINWGSDAQKKTWRAEKWQQQWQPIDQETWAAKPQTPQMLDSKYSHRFLDSANNGYMLAPYAGKDSANDKGEDGFVYFTENPVEGDEGERDLVTLGACCNADHQQGPEQFIQESQSLKDKELVFWYVPFLKNNGTPEQKYCWADNVAENGVMVTKTWPCAAGAMFVPFNEG
jgi:hypothetical protein